jgi:hypothetical protein
MPATGSVASSSMSCRLHPRLGWESLEMIRVTLVGSSSWTACHAATASCMLSSSMFVGGVGGGVVPR